jgi:hypothetical protein
VRRGRPEFRRAAGALSRGRCGGGLGAHQGPVCGRRRRRGGSGELGQQAQGGSGRCGFKTGEPDGNAWRLKTQEGVLACGEGLRGFGRLGEQVEGKLAVGAPMVVRRSQGAGARCGRARGHNDRFIARGQGE